MSENVKAVVVGAAGRMGIKVINAIMETEGIELFGALESPNHISLGKDAGIIAGVGELGIDLIASNIPDYNATKKFEDADVVINFTTPESVRDIADSCRRYKTPMVIGTTAIPPDALSKIQELSKIVPVVMAPNFSIGANAIFVLLPEMLKLLGQTFTDFNVSEIHHTEKKDAPSGTAKKMAQIIAKEKGWNITDIFYTLEGKKQPDKVYVVATRSGDTIGEHHVLIASKTERIEISHKVSTRDAFAEGAVRAAIFTAHVVKGMHDMTDVIIPKKMQSMWHSAILAG